MVPVSAIISQMHKEGILNLCATSRPVYNAYMKEQAFYYYLYFIFNAFHIAFCIYSLIGIPSTGSAGIINTISAFANAHIVAGVFCIISTVAWGVESVSCRWSWFALMRIVD